MNTVAPEPGKVGYKEEINGTRWLHDVGNSESERP